MSELERDVVTIKILPQRRETGQKGECGGKIFVGTSSILGTRKNQEDSIFGSALDGGAFAIVCDGMGGLAAGELASQTAVESIAKAWYERQETENIPRFFKEAAVKADALVYALADENGERLNAGTTVTAVAIKGRELYWLSVGDSRIYIIRGQEIMAVNTEHNYGMALKSRLEQGLIGQAEYEQEMMHADALISYLGMGNVSLIDVNKTPFLLEGGDMIVLASDGLYRSLSDREVLGILRENQNDMQKAADMLTSAALGEKKKGQDNTSVVAMRYSTGNTKNPAG